MLQRLRQWWTREREWRREHLSAWSSVTPAGRGTLSAFQADAEHAVREQLDVLGVGLTDRELVLDKDQLPTVVARIEGTGITLWIYADEAQVVGPGVDVRLEKWDARTPAELKNRFVDAVIRAVNGISGSVA